MSSNIEKINYNDFKNICRTCLCKCDFKFTEDGTISDLYYKLTGVPFVTIDEFPQQICLKCFDKINEIHEFSLQCKQNQLKLTKYLTYYKKNEKYLKTETILPETSTSKIEFISVKEEIVEEATTLEDEPFIFNLEDDADSNEAPSTSAINPEIRKPPKYPVVKKKNPEFDDSPEETEAEFNKKKKTGFKEYKCDFCEETFCFLSSLVDHKIEHSGERPFECHVCGKRFKYSQGLSRHKRLHCTDRKFVCQICSKVFKKSRDLTAHTKMHSSERLHECDVCKKWFKFERDLERHKWIHSGERLYQCDVCNETFLESNELNRHKKIHCPLDANMDLVMDIEIKKEENSD